MSGCEQYIVNLAPMNANTVYVSEVWRSEADHESLLQVESVKALVLQGETSRGDLRECQLQPVGGKGLSAS